MSERIEIWGVTGLPEITAGTDLGDLLVGASADLRTGDIVVVTSKIVSKAEGQLVPGSRDERIAGETARVVARRGDTQIVETHHGFVLAAAGIDASNVPAGTVALLPLDPDASARRIRERIRETLDVDVAVIVSDTMGRPWREGVIDTAIGAAGIDVLSDLRGRRDLSGHLLEATVIAIADELASAAELVKGKLTATPVAVIRGFSFSRNDPDRGARPLVRSPAADMFRLGTREAKAQVVLDSAPLAAGNPSQLALSDRDQAAVRGAVDAVRTNEVALAISDDGAVVSAAGDPLSVGVVLGRLLAALAAEDLRGIVRVSPPGATAEVAVVAPND